MSGFTEDIEVYLSLCKYYKVDIQYTNNNVPDVYGHGDKLWKRLQNDRKGKPWRQLEDWETFDNNKDVLDK